jgi:hypothetical protein
MVPWKMVMAIRCAAQVEKALRRPLAECILRMVTKMTIYEKRMVSSVLTALNVEKMNSSNRLTKVSEQERESSEENSQKKMIDDIDTTER